MTLCWVRPCHAASSQPGDLEFQTGFNLYQSGKYQEALHHFYLSADENLDSWQTYHMIGNCYFVLQNRDAALGAYRESLRINPKNTSLLDHFKKLQSSLSSTPSLKLHPIDEITAVEAKHPPVTVPFDLLAQVSGYGMPYPIHSLKPATPRFPLWVKLNSCFGFANMQDFESGAQSWNKSLTTNNQGAVASVRNSGVELGVESGCNLDSANVFSFGLEYLGGEGYQVSVVSSSSQLLQSVTPDTYSMGVNYYRNLTGGRSRLYAMGGVGYYFTQVRYYQSDPESPVAGNLSGGTLGGVIGIGNEWYLTREVGLEISGRFRYAKINQVQGNVSNQASGTTSALAVLRNGTLGVQSSESLSQGNGDYASIDYTGFDLRLSTDLYLF